MTAPSVGVKDILVTAGVGVFTSPSSSDWAIKISKVPDAPDKVIVLFDSGGLPANPRWLLDYPDVTVIVRGTVYVDTYAKMKAVMDALLGYPPGAVNGDNWDGVIMRVAPAFIGYDQKDRPQFSATFGLFVEPANAAGDNRLPL